METDALTNDIVDDDRRQRRGPVGVPGFENDVAGHRHRGVAERRERREIGLQVAIRRGHRRQRLMGVEQRAAVAGDMLDDADDAARLQSAEDRAAKRGDAHRFAAERAIADDIAGPRLADVEQRQAVDGNAHLGKHGSERHRVEPRRFDRAGGGAVIQGVERRAARERRPFRRLHPRHAPAFLIDQDRQVGAAVETTKLVGQAPQLVAIFDVAPEQNISCRVAVAEKGALIVGEGQARQAENSRYHRPSNSIGSRPLRQQPRQEYAIRTGAHQRSLRPSGPNQRTTTQFSPATRNFPHKFAALAAVPADTRKR